MSFSLLRSYSPRPIDASFAASGAFLGVAAFRYTTLSRWSLSGCLISAVACAAIGALRFLGDNPLQEIQARITLAIEYRGWDVIESPQKELERYGAAIENLCQRRLEKLEQDYSNEVPLSVDLFHKELYKATTNHPAASHFYLHLKGTLFRNLNGILPLSSGSVARTFTTATDYGGAILRAGASVPVIGPLINAAGNGCSFMANASELSYYQKAAQLFSDDESASFFIRWMALHYTQRCAKSLPYLDKKVAEDLAEKIATCTLQHLVYTHPKRSIEDAFFDLLNECKTIAEKVDWDAHKETEYRVKETLHSIHKVIKLAKILGLVS